MEPKSKRLKITQEIADQSSLSTTSNGGNMQIKCILPDECIKQIETIKVIIGTIDNMKTISSLMNELSRNVPLLDLQHLKRVRKNQIIICKLETIDKEHCTEIIDDKMKDSVHSFLMNQNMDLNIVAELGAKLSIAEAASIQPKLRWQYDTMNRIWPCKFHPNKYLEGLYSNTNFTENETAFHLKIMAAVKCLISKESIESSGICIDPRTGSIVAIGTERTQINSLLHCPMVLIDMVARSQNGGVWEYQNETFMDNNDKLNLSGIQKKYYEILEENFNDLQFGAEMVDPNRKICNLESMEQDNLSKYGPYLCTGYDVYLWEEPCLMCAMALIHSRVKRVFYTNKTAKGALGSLLKLHTVKELNHHFEVFQVVENISS